MDTLLPLVGTMKNVKGEIQIPMQVGSELRINNDGSIVVDNTELELAPDSEAADAVLAYHFDARAAVHVLRLLEPVADHRHVHARRPND